MPKLTLSADLTTVDLAKALAAKDGTSVSAMFERFVALTAVQRGVSAKVAPLTRRISGVIKLPKGANARRVLEDALLERNGLKP